MRHRRRRDTDTAVTDVLTDPGAPITPVTQTECVWCEGRGFLDTGMLCRACEGTGIPQRQRPHHWMDAGGCDFDDEPTIPYGLIRGEDADE